MDSFNKYETGVELFPVNPTTPFNKRVSYAVCENEDGKYIQDDNGFNVFHTGRKFKTVTTSPWNDQVGGTHYKEKAIQPLQLTLSNLGYVAFSGACYTKINKYTTRIKDNQVEQLKKARHVLDLWIHEAEKQQNES